MTTWKDIVQNKDSMIRPLYNKLWVLNELKKNMMAYGDYELEETDSVLSEYDGSLVVGTPVDDMYDDERSMMFGLQSDEYLDDRGILDYILRDMFTPLINIGILEVGSMESVCSVSFGEDLPPANEIWNVLSYVIGESLTVPGSESKSKISTADCKAHMKEKFSFENMKRTKKHKMGSIEFREFGNGEDECTVLSYNGRIICSYPFNSGDYE